MQLMDRVEARLAESWPLDRIAQEAGFSPFHFHRTFRAAVGETPTDFIERLRLERAALLLLASEEPITHLAMDVGYGRPETFARRFRARFSVSARDYRSHQMQLWSELGLDAGKDPLGEPGEIVVTHLPESKIEVRRSRGEDEGFTFDPDQPPWSDWDRPDARTAKPVTTAATDRFGLTLDWPGITPPGFVRQDWGRVFDGHTVSDGWVARSIGGGTYASLHVPGTGPVPPTIYQRLYVWSMAGRYRLRPGPILECFHDQAIIVHQPVRDTEEE